MRGEYKKPPACAPPPSAPSSARGSPEAAAARRLSTSLAECDPIPTLAECEDGGSDLEGELPSEFAFGLNLTVATAKPPPKPALVSISGFPSLVFSIADADAAAGDSYGWPQTPVADADADADAVDMPEEFAHQLLRLPPAARPAAPPAAAAAWPFGPGPAAAASCCVSRPGHALKRQAGRRGLGAMTSSDNNARSPPGAAKRHGATKSKVATPKSTPIPNPNPNPTLSPNPNPNPNPNQAATPKSNQKRKAHGGTGPAARARRTSTGVRA